MGLSIGGGHNVPPEINRGEAPGSSGWTIPNSEVTALIPFLGQAYVPNHNPTPAEAKAFLESLPGTGSASTYKNLLSVLNVIITSMQTDLGNGNWSGFQTALDATKYFIPSGTLTPATNAPGYGVGASGTDLLGVVNMGYNFNDGQNDPKYGDASAKDTWKVMDALAGMWGMSTNFSTVEYGGTTFNVVVTQKETSPDMTTAWALETYPPAPSSAVLTQMKSDLSTLDTNISAAISGA
ncbi:MAG: hypothetical protein P0S95_04660 [Rhabdochlamydiaceae bacterium]|nr:hypothetical protein [Candidatus Amphrikana amoebophyrae]